MGQEYKQAWYSFLKTKGSIHTDPGSHDISMLNEFLLMAFGISKEADAAAAANASASGDLADDDGDEGDWIYPNCGDHQSAWRAIPSVKSVALLSLKPPLLL